jgi:hypothetical protein
MKRIIRISLLLLVILANNAFAQMQDNPVTESGEHVAVSEGSVSNLALSGATEALTATGGTMVVNYNTLTNMGAFVPVYAEGWATNGSITLTNQSVYYTWTTWTPGEYTSGIMWTNNGIQISSASAAGMYEITGHLAVSQNQNGEELEAGIFKGANGVATNGMEKMSGHQYMATSGRPYSLPVGGYTRLVLNDYLEVKFKNTTGAGRVVSAQDGIINFRMKKIGP